MKKILTVMACLLLFMTVSAQSMKVVVNSKTSEVVDYIAPEDYSMCFFAFRTMDDETLILDMNGTYITKRPNAQGVEIPKIR